MSLDRRLEVLNQENYALRERVAELEAALSGDGFVAPLEWRLTAQEARVFGVLLAREIASKEAFMAALYENRPDADQPEPKIVDVMICKLRRKLKPFGIGIVCLWGRGHSLAPGARARLRGEAAERRRA